MLQTCSATSMAASVPMRFAPVKYPTITPVRQFSGKNAENSRRDGKTSGFPIQFCAIIGAKKKTAAATHTLKIRLYAVQPDRTQVILWGRFLPICSAVKYIVAVRMPAIPATNAMEPTLITSCKRPMPSAPIREDKYT